MTMVEDRVVLRDQAGEKVHDVRLQRLLVPTPIGKARIVRDIDEPPVRHENARFTQHCEAAYAAVKEEDRLRI
jgi:hypothetical protein